MALLKTFLRKYWPSVLTVTVVFMTALVVFQMTGINFTPYEDKRVDKIVTIEGFGPSSSMEAVHKKHKGDVKTLHKVCSDMSKEACGAASYCVLLNGATCVGGDKAGPTYLTKDGKKVDVNYYIHKGKCVGDCKDYDKA